MTIVIGTNRSDNLTGSAFEDIIVSGNGADVIDGGAGNDVIASGNGADTVYGGDGDDAVTAGRGDDAVYGGLGNDLISGGRGDDELDGGDGDDAVLGGRGDDRLTGGLGNDYLNGGKGTDTAVYFGDIRTYSFTFEPDWLTITDTATGDADLVVAVEILEFDNATVYLDGRNNGPIADDVLAEAHEDGPAVAGDLLAESGAFDFDGDSLSITAVEGSAGNVGNQIVLASGALLTIAADGTYAYDPNGQFEDLNDGETGTDSATFTVSDGTDTVTRTVTFEIEGETDNLAPVAQDVLYTFDENGPYPALSFVVSDENPATLDYTSPGMLVPPIAIIIPNPTTKFVNEGDGSIGLVRGEDLQSVAEGETRDWTFTYWATDEFGAVSNEATVTIRVIGENDAPRLPTGVGIGIFQVDEDSGGMTLPFHLIDPDTDDDVTTLAFTFNTTTGSPTNNGNGTFSIDTDAFDYLAVGQTFLVSFTATDRHGASTTLSTLEIAGLNDDPDAMDDAFGTDEDTAVSGSLFADNGNGFDFDIDDGDTFTVTAIDGVALTGSPETVVLASNALLTIAADGTFTYDPNGQFDILETDEWTSDSFAYSITDQHGGTATATATVLIEGVSGDIPPDAGLFNA